MANDQSHAPATLLTGTAIAYGMEGQEAGWTDSRANLGAVGKMDLNEPGLEPRFRCRLAPSLVTTNTVQRKIFCLKNDNYMQKKLILRNTTQF
jgi:hypothetical protein